MRNAVSGREKLSKTLFLAVGAVGAVGTAILAYIGVQQWIADPTAGLSFEIRDASTTLRREPAGTYYVDLAGELAIVNNNSRSVLVKDICAQQYDAFTFNLGGASSCGTIQPSGIDGNLVRFPITVAAYDKLVLRYKQGLPVYNSLTTLAYETLLSQGMDLVELQKRIEDKGYDLFGQMRWKGDTIWLPCGDYLPEEPQDTGIVFNLETAEQVRLSCGMFLLDASFLFGGRLGRAQFTKTLPLEQFRRRSGPRPIWEHEELLRE